MAKYRGYNGSIKAGSTPTTIANLRNWSYDRQGAEIDTTVMGSSAAAFDVGPITSNGQAQIFWDPDDGGQDEIVVGATVAIELYPSEETSGKTKFAGNVVILSLNLSADVGGMVEGTIGWSAPAALTESTVA